MLESDVRQRILAWEMRVVIRANRLGRRSWPKVFFSWVSFLGNGWFWLAVGLALPFFYGRQALYTDLQVLVASGLAFLIYLWLKKSTSRPRPCDVGSDVSMLASPLDRYSFPSGHTLQAVALSLVFVFHHPPLAWGLVPFASLVAASRVVLGLHYPSDVLAGILVGAAVGGICLWVF